MPSDCDSSSIGSAPTLPIRAYRTGDLSSAGSRTRYRLRNAAIPKKATSHPKDVDTSTPVPSNQASDKKLGQGRENEPAQLLTRPGSLAPSREDDTLNDLESLVSVAPPSSSNSDAELRSFSCTDFDPSDAIQDDYTSDEDEIESLNDGQPGSSSDFIRCTSVQERAVRIAKKNAKFHAREIRRDKIQSTVAVLNVIPDKIEGIVMETARKIVERQKEDDPLNERTAPILGYGYANYVTETYEILKQTAKENEHYFLRHANNAKTELGRAFAEESTVEPRVVYDELQDKQPQSPRELPISPTKAGAEKASKVDLREDLGDLQARRIEAIAKTRFNKELKKIASFGKNIAHKAVSRLLRKASVNIATVAGGKLDTILEEMDRLVENEVGTLSRLLNAEAQGTDIDLANATAVDSIRRALEKDDPGMQNLNMRSRFFEKLHTSGLSGVAASSDLGVRSSDAEGWANADEYLKYKQGEILNMRVRSTLRRAQGLSSSSHEQNQANAKWTDSGNPSQRNPGQERSQTEEGAINQTNVEPMYSGSYIWDRVEDHFSNYPSIESEHKILRAGYAPGLDLKTWQTKDKATRHHKAWAKGHVAAPTGPRTSHQTLARLDNSKVPRYIPPHSREGYDSSSSKNLPMASSENSLEDADAALDTQTRTYLDELRDEEEQAVALCKSKVASVKTKSEKQLTRLADADRCIAEVTAETPRESVLDSQSYVTSKLSWADMSEDLDDEDFFCSMQLARSITPNMQLPAQENLLEETLAIETDETEQANATEQEPLLAQENLLEETLAIEADETEQASPTELEPHFLIPRNGYSDDEMIPSTSRGAQGHPDFCRNPCIYFWKGTCINGSQCMFCHRPHCKELRLNKRYRTRLHGLEYMKVYCLLVPIIRAKCGKGSPVYKRVSELLESVRDGACSQNSEPEERIGRIISTMQSGQILRLFKWLYMPKMPEEKKERFEQVMEEVTRLFESLAGWRETVVQDRKKSV